MHLFCDTILRNSVDMIDCAYPRTLTNNIDDFVLWLASYLTNHSTKEISVVTQQSVCTVYQRKNNIRQTLNMPEGEDIISYLSFPA